MYNTGIYCDALYYEVLEDKFLVLDSAKLKHLEADSATGSWTLRVTTEDESGD